MFPARLCRLGKCYDPRDHTNEHEYVTLAELTKAGLISNELLQSSAHKIELSVSNTHFEISAVPREYGKTGKRSFFLDETSVIRAGDHGGGAATISDKPIQ